MKRSGPARWCGVRWTNSACAIAIRSRPRASSPRSATATARAWRCAPTWTRFPFTRKPRSRSAARWTARCTRADTTVTRRCCSAPLACSRNASRRCAGRSSCSFSRRRKAAREAIACARKARSSSPMCSASSESTSGRICRQAPSDRAPESSLRRRACSRSRSLGKGGHAAMPHTTFDPVATAAKIICELQTIVSREVDPLEPAVVSVTTVHGGDAHNVIPQSVKMTGTVRSLSLPGLRYLQQRVREVSGQVAAANRCEAIVEFPGNDYPPVINDEACWRSVRATAAELVGEGAVLRVATRDGRRGFRVLHAARSRLFRRARRQAGRRRRCVRRAPPAIHCERKSAARWGSAPCVATPCGRSRNSATPPASAPNPPPPPRTPPPRMPPPRKPPR